MSKKDTGYVPGFSTGITYESPKVTRQTLDDGGNYVSSASKPGGAGTLGTSIIE